MRASATLMSNTAFYQGQDPIGSKKALDLSLGLHRGADEPVGRVRGHAARAACRGPRHCVPVFLDALRPRPDRGRSRLRISDFRANQDALYRVFDALNQLTASDYAASREIEAHAEHLETTAVGILSVAIETAVGLSAILAWALASSLLMPIKTLTASATALGEETSKVEGPGVLERRAGKPGAVLQHDGRAPSCLQGRHPGQGAEDAAHHGGHADHGARAALRRLEGGRRRIRNPAAEELSKIPEFAGGMPEGLAGPLSSSSRRASTTCRPTTAGWSPSV